ncbi:MAG TPA: hypothetical protein P5016_14170 [Verrucomicrobiales bacterium]|nr:hypothetical protein [Verrucomicrobiae bacterium]MCP5552758.1 hypothetical protein [Akkermansiaceae bacterium]HRX55658.1 hypothetical protein [Verrucomicrobiales bacterium]
MRYELWHSSSDGCHTFFPANQHPGDLPEDARCIWTVEASSWEAANAAKHDFLGWEPYRPMPDNDPADPTP